MQNKVYTGYDEMGDSYETEDLKFQGKPSLLEYLSQNKEIFNLIYQQVMKKLEA